MCWRLIKNAGIDEVVYADDDAESPGFGTLVRVRAQEVMLAELHSPRREEC
jgi:tRNA(Arg) A34 adenosine deaminase TadA